MAALGVFNIVWVELIATAGVHVEAGPVILMIAFVIEQARSSIVLAILPHRHHLTLALLRGLIHVLRDLVAGSFWHADGVGVHVVERNCFVTQALFLIVLRHL